MSDKFVEEHYQKHTITEIEHFPGHDERVETLIFRNAKRELESVEHIGCYICGSMEKRESHHIFERSYWNALDVAKVAHLLYHHFDFHGHCKRDFESEEALLQYFIDHFNGQKFEYFDESGATRIGYTCDDEAADTIYNQLILDAEHHREAGKSAHGATFATFVAWMARKDGFDISLSAKEYEELKRRGDAA